MHVDAMNIQSIAQRQLACLGDASRFRIVTELTGGRACVTELAARIGLSQSCTTRHLQALVRAGLVTRERSGRRVLFEMRSADPAVRSLLDWKSRLETDLDWEPGSTGGPGGGRHTRRASTAGRGRPSTTTGSSTGLSASPGSEDPRGGDPPTPTPAPEAVHGGRDVTPEDPNGPSPRRRPGQDLEDFLL